MEYGLTFVVDMYDFEKDEEMHVLTLPGDYIRTTRWMRENGVEDESETVTNLRRNYAIAWHALKRRGKVDEIGLPDELDLEGVEAMSYRFSVFVNEMGDELLPLTRERAT